MKLRALSPSAPQLRGGGVINLMRRTENQRRHLFKVTQQIKVSLGI